MRSNLLSSPVRQRGVAGVIFLVVPLSFFLVLGVLLLSATGALAQKTTPPHSAAALTFQRVWPFTGNNTAGASVAVDAAGGIHMGFSAHTSAGGVWPAYYAYCAANCQSAANWTTTIVGDIGAWGGSTRLTLDAAGHPRLLWFNETSISGPGVFQYAECNAACTNAASWTKADAAATSSAVAASYSSRYFVLEQQGHPRFIYTDTDSDHLGTYYAYCDTGCSVSATNWHEVQISSTYLLYDFSLVFDTDNGVHLAYRDATAYPDRLGYAVCASNCTNADNWNSLTLTDLGSGAAFSLRVDAQQRPRLAFYLGYLGSSDPDNHLLEYAWCNTACLEASSWDSYALGLPAYYGAEVDLALDQQNRPQLAYYVDDVIGSAYGLGYAACTTNCETSSAAWQAQFIETSDDLDASDPIPPQSGCSISSWLEVGHAPALALDAGGNPRVGYTAEHYQGGTCSIHSDMQLVRFALAGNTTPPAPTPPTSVIINGPAYGVIETAYTFTATVSLITATTPMTYVWQATGLATQTHAGRGTSDTATFTWPSGATGAKTITVSATNRAGTKQGSRSIMITVTPIVFNHWVYLPAIIK